MLHTDVATTAYPPVAPGAPFTVWAPYAASVALKVDEQIHPLLASTTHAGWFHSGDLHAVDGQRYSFQLNGEGPWVPDPRSRFQPDGVHGPSQVVDLEALRERVRHVSHAETAAWTGADVRGGVLYEVHVGTFAPGAHGEPGTFDSAIAKLDHLSELGVDAVEIMPVAEFPGERGWGYDGVGMYSVHHAYGGPAGLMRFVHEAHARGIAVILDVVHNHFGPSGNYSGVFGPYFTDAYETPWGLALNLDREGSADVRAFVLDSMRQWLLDYGLDGLRLDAVHELMDHSGRHILAEMSDAVAVWSEVAQRPLRLIAESDRNDPRTVTPTQAGGLGMDLQWADDIHHAVHAWISGERQGYYVDFGDADVVRATLTEMFLHAGTYSTFREKVWGAPVDPDTDLYNGHSFVSFLQDHDQIGNRAGGDRLHHAISPEQHAAAIALILTSATTPMLFQGEEWATSSPFAFFTDHDAELGPLVSRGRREEFSAMGWDLDAILDPQAEATFRVSQLSWDERDMPEHARMFQWYQALIELRRTQPALRSPNLRGISVEVPSEDALVVHRKAVGESAGVSVLVSRGEEASVIPSGTVLASFGTVQDSLLLGPGAVVVLQG